MSTATQAIVEKLAGVQGGSPQPYASAPDRTSPAYMEKLAQASEYLADHWGDVDTTVVPVAAPATTETRTASVVSRVLSNLKEKQASAQATKVGNIADTILSKIAGAAPASNIEPEAEGADGYEAADGTEEDEGTAEQNSDSDAAELIMSELLSEALNVSDEPESPESTPAETGALRDDEQAETGNKLEMRKRLVQRLRLLQGGRDGA